MMFFIFFFVAVVVVVDKAIEQGRELKASGQRRQITPAGSLVEPQADISADQENIRPLRKKTTRKMPIITF